MQVQMAINYAALSLTWTIVGFLLLSHWFACAHHACVKIRTYNLHVTFAYGTYTTPLPYFVLRYRSCNDGTQQLIKSHILVL